MNYTSPYICHKSLKRGGGLGGAGREVNSSQGKGERGRTSGEGSGNKMQNDFKIFIYPRTWWRSPEKLPVRHTQA